MARITFDVYRKIHRIVIKYLIEHIGEMTMQGPPQYDEQLQRWRVPIMCRTTRGILPAGEIQLTKRLRIAFVTSREDMLQTLEAQLKQLEQLPVSPLPLALFNATSAKSG